MDTIDLKLHLKGTERKDESPTVMLESYSDAEYAANRTDRKSVGGGVICLHGMIVGWMFRKKQRGSIDDGR